MYPFYICVELVFYFLILSLFIVSLLHQNTKANPLYVTSSWAVNLIVIRSLCGGQESREEEVFSDSPGAVWA